MSTILACCEECGRNLRVRPELAGRRVRCPDCGAPVQVPSASPPRTAKPRISRSVPQRRDSTSVPSTLQQLKDNPLRTMVMGVDAGEYEAAQRGENQIRRNKLILAALIAGWLGMALLGGLVALIRFGVAIGAMFVVMSLAFSLLPMAFGMLFAGGSLLDWHFLFYSKQGRGIRKMMGDRGARTFYLIAAAGFILISYGTVFFFLLGAVFGDD